MSLVDSTGTTYYYVTNARGDVVRILDAGGNSVADYSYDPWGIVTVGGSSAIKDQPIRYSSYVHDAETNLYYLQARYYDPDNARFVSRDPDSGSITNPLSQNAYAYCGDDPVNMVDPTGLIFGFDDAVEITALALYFAALSLAAYLGNEALQENRDAIIKTVSQSINAMRVKADSAENKSPQGEQYSLRAATSGLYPNVRGGLTYLQAGEVWKYGETTGQRYSQQWLSSQKLRYQWEYRGNQLQCKVVEKEKILQYFIDKRTLPPGNRIFR